MKKYLFAFLALAVSSTLYTQLAHAQGTAFTYQGQLLDSGRPANGLYDVSFSVYHAAAGGSSDGAITNQGIAVSNGLFTTTLDFHGTPDGSLIWFELGVRTNGDASLTTISPRQALTPTPYALFATVASNLVGSLPVGQLSGTIAATQLPPSVLTNGGSGVSLSGMFSGNGAGLTGINPTNLAAADTDIVFSPLEIRDPSGFATVSQPYSAAVRLRTIAGGGPADGYFILPLNLPAKVLGVPQKLKRVKVAYQVATNSASSIYFTRIDQLDDAMQTTLAISDFQTHSNQTPSTYAFTNNSPSLLTGGAFLSLYTHFNYYSSDYSTNYISLGTITVTVGP